MLNKAQLQTNNTALDGYIARINAAKEVVASLPEAGGGGSGGGSVDTCTVTFSTHTMAAHPLYAVTRYVNGEIVCEYGTFSQEKSAQYDDVVCGSLVIVSDQDLICYAANYTDNIIPIDVGYGFPYDSTSLFIAAAPTEPNTVGTIEFE